MSPREPKRREMAERTWASMRAFVDGNSKIGTIQDYLGLGAGRGRLKVLLLLQHGPLSPKEIAEAHSIDAPYATLIVDQLESRGLVERGPWEGDRRRKLVSLTAAGRHAAKYAKEVMAAPPAALLKLSPMELEQLGSIMARLVDPDAPSKHPTDPSGRPGGSDR
jgi:DNA-binding MarR family transcriptional regulator